MTNEQFEEILNKRLELIRNVLGTKAKEYAFGGDRLHNFKVAARAMEEPMRQALWGMAMKHLVSVIDLVEGRLPNTQANCDEKIGDMINYLILLEAALEAERFFSL